jgi:hypothetical protein
MVKRFFLFALVSGSILYAATDYFPIQVGNAWTFSYVSIAAPVIPNPPTTKDSGTVKWEIVSNGMLEPLTEEILLVGVKQTRSLVRRTLTNSEPPGDYDSVFTPPRMIIDTVRFWQPLLVSNAIPISFETDTCPFAVHYPTVAMPTGLSSKDTTVSFQGAPVAAKKMIVSDCSCLKERYLYSFTLGPTIGPVEAYITMCPNLAGSSFKETWELISREYPITISRASTPSVLLEAATANQSLGRIFCSLDLGYSSLVQIEFLDVRGRLIKTLFKGNLNAGAYRYSWNIPTKTVGIALLRVRTRAEDRCIQIQNFSIISGGRL